MLRNFYGVLVIQTRGKWGMKPNRHWDPKYKKLRREKFIEVDLESVRELQHLKSGSVTDRTPEEYRTILKKLGIQPDAFSDRPPVHLSTLNQIVDEFKPFENEGKTSYFNPIQLSKTVLRSRTDRKANKKIKECLKEFNIKDFPLEAIEIYKKAQKAIMDRDEERIHGLLTETLFTQVWDEYRLRSISWEWVETVEPPKIVRKRVASLLEDDDFFAQLTLRFMSRQRLAIYDRFGHLMWGDPDVAQDVLEYVVFENHITSENPIWRVHAKIHPPQKPWYPRFVNFMLTAIRKSSTESSDGMAANSDSSSVEKVTTKAG